MRRPVSAALKETLRFMEIYNHVSDPYKFARDNYEAAEAEYSRQYGQRRFKSHAVFINARYRANLPIQRRYKTNQYE